MSLQMNNYNIKIIGNGSAQNNAVPLSTRNSGVLELSSQIGSRITKFGLVFTFFFRNEILFA